MATLVDGDGRAGAREPATIARCDRRRRAARRGTARGVRAAGGGDLRGLSAALRRAARRALARGRPAGARRAIACMRSGWRGWSRWATRARSPSWPTRSRSRRSPRARANRRWPRRCGSPARAPWGGAPPTRTARPRSWCFAGAPERSRRCAQAPPGVRRRPETRLDIVRRRCQTSTPSTSPGTRSTADPRRIRGRDDHPPPVHDRSAPRARA